MLLHAPLLVPSDAAARGKNRELPQAAPSAATPRTGVREEQQPHQRGAPGIRRPQPPSAHGGCRAAPRPAARAQRRPRARNKAQGAAAGRAQCRCTKNRDQRGGAAAPEGRTWPLTAPAHLPTEAVVLLHAPLLVPSDAAARGKKPRELPQAAPSATRGRPSLATPLPRARDHVHLLVKTMPAYLSQMCFRKGSAPCFFSWPCLDVVLAAARRLRCDPGGRMGAQGVG